MKVSVRKISEATGFSPATVSNALNRKKGVNQETANRIWKVANEMGYAAANKITKIKFVIFRKNGDIIDDSHFHPSVIEGVEKEARDKGFETVFVHLDCDDRDYKQQVSELLNDTSSAIILLGTEMGEEDFPMFEHSACPMVVLDGWSDRIAFDAVLISNTDSACKAVEYLAAHGHERIGYLRGDFRIQAFRYREIGYCRAMSRLGLTVYKNYIVNVGCKMETAYEDVKQYLEKEEKIPTAFFADNDEIAMGAMRAIKEKGLRIPEDVSIIGFDNISFGAIANPGLTTMHVHKHDMGKAAVRRLLEIIGNPDEAKMKLQVCTDFVERGSVLTIK